MWPFSSSSSPSGDGDRQPPPPIPEPSSSRPPELSATPVLRTGALRAPPESAEPPKGKVIGDDGTINFSANAPMRVIKATAITTIAVSIATGIWGVYRLKTRPVVLARQSLMGSAPLAFTFFAIREYAITPLLSGDSWEEERGFSRDQVERPRMSSLIVDSFLAGQATSMGVCLLAKRPPLPTHIAFAVVAPVGQILANAARLFVWRRAHKPRSDLQGNYDEPNDTPGGNIAKFRNQLIFPPEELDPAVRKRRMAYELGVDPDGTPSYLQPLPTYGPDPEAQKLSVWRIIASSKHNPFFRRRSDEETQADLRAELQRLHKQKEEVTQARAAHAERVRWLEQQLGSNPAHAAPAGTRLI